MTTYWPSYFALVTFWIMTMAAIIRLVIMINVWQKGSKICFVLFIKDNFWFLTMKAKPALHESMYETYWFKIATLNYTSLCCIIKKHQPTKSRFFNPASKVIGVVAIGTLGTQALPNKERNLSIRNQKVFKYWAQYKEISSKFKWIVLNLGHQQLILLSSQYCTWNISNRNQEREKVPSLENASTTPMILW